MTPALKTEPLSFRRAFEAERQRRDEERRARDEAERRQQAEDLSRAEQLQAILAEDAAFLEERGLSVDRRRYTVALHHKDFLIDAYFDGGQATVRAASKRGAPGREQTVDSMEAALALMAEYLADETR